MTRNLPLISAEVASLCAESQRLRLSRNAEWIREQLLELSRMARENPHRWPTDRYITATLAIALGDVDWRATSSQTKEG